MKTHHNKYTNPPKNVNIFKSIKLFNPEPQNTDYPEKGIKDITKQKNSTSKLGAHPSLPPHPLSPGQVYSMK